MSDKSCARCIHRKVCYMDSSGPCIRFKDRYMVADLPCTVGQDVFYLYRSCECLTYERLIVESITIDKYGVGKIVAIEPELWNSEKIRPEDLSLGRYVFSQDRKNMWLLRFSIKEAEEAVREDQRND